MRHKRALQRLFTLLIVILSLHIYYLFSLIVFKIFLFVICFKQFDYGVPSYGFFMCLVLGIQWASWNCGFIVFIKFGICHQSLSFVSFFSSCLLETQIKWDWFTDALVIYFSLFSLYFILDSFYWYAFKSLNFMQCLLLLLSRFSHVRLCATP